MELRELSRYFPSEIISRGDSYFAFKRVKAVQRVEDAFVANVQGTQLYRVTLKEYQGDLLATCSCPYYAQSQSFCKHQWAVLKFLQDRPGFPGWLRGCHKLVRTFDLGEVPAAPQTLRLKTPRKAAYQPALPRPRTTVLQMRPPAQPSWGEQLARVSSGLEASQRKIFTGYTQPEPVLYALDLDGTFCPDSLTFLFFVRKPKPKGEDDLYKPFHMSRGVLESMPPEDQTIASFLFAGVPHWMLMGQYQDRHDRVTIPNLLARTALPMLCKTGRFYLRDRVTSQWHGPLRWDEDGRYSFALKVNHRESTDGRETPGGLDVRGVFYRGEPPEPHPEPPMLRLPGLLVFADRVAPFEDPGAEEWLPMMREQVGCRVPAREVEKFISTIYALRKLPAIEFPADLQVEELKEIPRIELNISRAENYWNSRLHGRLRFEYGEMLLEESDPRERVLCPETRKLYVRNPEVEQGAKTRLLELGIRGLVGCFVQNEFRWEVPQSRFSETVLTLVQEGWRVNAEGKLYRRSSKFNIEVTSGIDWFDLHATVQYEGQEATLSALLEALRRKESFVVLGDGSLGMLPEEWLHRYALFAGMGRPVDDSLRFHKTQAGLLDLLLAEQPEVSVDETFQRVRAELREFAGIQPLQPARGFRGALRPYQQEGLGWLAFLRRFGLGGCLADDMGLGKTVQVLALLAMIRSRRRSSDPRDRRPSLVVAPKSVVFNWLKEAARFAPRLRVAQLNGLDRRRILRNINKYDLVVTTYGILRRDVTELRHIQFDTLILDEAQAIKNANTTSAKAARLLQADHRLAMSGTPIENHLGELWSLFEFLNPGMLGRATVFQATSRSSKDLDPETLKMLARALRPFILRRTKEQVAADLPAKHEQLVYCELKGPQHKIYEELRAHYRRCLLPEISEGGVKKHSIQILEALLRLRQAAIHPGLVDPKKKDQPSAKLDLLLEQLEEVLEEGHKVLIFSQFVSMLSIVQEKLRQKKIPFAYLDGQTQDREGCVARFQTDPECPVFLISLKAGGLGLNLTAADYVFILDPWWNPAVEAQAVDRAHRIGQTRPVFTYRLLAKDTVEEKILTLQQSKKKLVESILCPENSLIRNLTREDLDVLLS